MLSEFTSLLELFAGFGLAVYFLAESEVAKQLFVKSYEERQKERLLTELKKETGTREKRNKLSPDEGIELLRGSLEETSQIQADFIKKDIAALRHDFLAISLYAVCLIIISGFERSIPADLIPVVVFNFSVVVMIMIFDRGVSGETYEEELHKMLGKEALRALAGLGFSFLLAFWFRPAVSTIFAKCLLVMVVLFPLFLFSLRFYRSLGKRYYRQKRKERTTASNQSTAAIITPPGSASVS